MKHLLLASCAWMILWAPCYGQSDWSWQNPLPQGNSLHGICIVNDRTVVAVGRMGTVIKSTDRGSTWEVQAIAAGVTTALNSVWFGNALHGVAVGDFGVIIRTTNGGRTWVRIPKVTRFDLRAVRLTNQLEGIAVGVGGTILHTTDAGASWSMQSSGVTNILLDLTFLTPRRVLIVGDGVILRSKNDGSSWESVNIPVQISLWGISFNNPHMGYAVGLDGTVLQSADAGKSWRIVANVTSYPLYDVWSDRNAIYVLSGYEVFRSTDGGKMWVKQLSTESMGYLGISALGFFDATIGITVGQHGTIFRTTNSGNVWENYLHGSQQDLNGIVFADSKVGLAVGNNGTILRTPDAGNHWTSQAGGIVSNLFGVSLLNSGTGIAVGENGTILRTTDSGITWVVVTSPTTHRLRTVSLTNVRTGIIGGDFDSVLTTTDDGRSWTADPIGGSSGVISIRHASPEIAFAIGSGVILKTTSSGRTWIPQKPFVAFPLWGLSVYNENVATAVGGSGIILRTTDGGSTWVEQESGTYVRLTTVLFADAENGIIAGSIHAGSQGVVELRTSDGGSTWRSSLAGIEQHVNAGWIGPNGYTTIVGSHGTIAQRIMEPSYMIPAENQSTEYLGVPALQQNYPNPFNPSTTFQYFLSARGHVNLKIYNMLGDEIATLVNQDQSPGSYSIDWNGEKFSSGIYFSRLTIGRSVETKKLVLLK